MICQPLLFRSRNLTSAPTGPLPHPLDHENAKLYTPQTTPSGTSAQPSSARRSNSRITDRTIQTLRETNMLVCNRKRSWPEILPVCESPRLVQTGNGLRSTRVQRTGGLTLVELQSGARHFGRNLQHQSRIIIPTRGVVVTACRRLFARQRSPCLVFL